jgi:hypothetical protein
MSTVITRSEPIKACKLTLEDIKRLYLKLKDSVQEAGRTTVSGITQLETTSDEEFKSFKDQVLSTFVISIVIRGDKGETLVETSEAIFSSPSLPNKITNVYFDSVATYKAKYNLLPAQWFTLNIDFSSPKLLDWQNALSAPTPNASNVVIQGSDETWVVGVLHKIQETIIEGATARDFIHKSFSYDLGLWFVGVPAAFYIASKFSSFISRNFSNSKFLIFAGHFYLFVMALLCYRIMYGYTKWAFPKIELDNGKGLAKKHRVFWWLLISGLLISLLTDLIKEHLPSLYPPHKS